MPLLQKLFDLLTACGPIASSSSEAEQDEPPPQPTPPPPTSVSSATIAALLALLAEKAREPLRALAQGEGTALVIRAEDAQGAINAPLAAFLNELAELPQLQLHHLTLRGLGLDSTATPALCKLAFSSKTVSSIDLSDNCLPPADLQQLLAAVPSFTRLTHLSVASEKATPPLSVLTAALEAAQRAQGLERLVLLSSGQHSELRYEPDDTATEMLKTIDEIATVLNSRKGETLGAGGVQERGSNQRADSRRQAGGMRKEFYTCVTQPLHTLARDQAASHIAGQLASSIAAGLLKSTATPSPPAPEQKPSP
ncbi:hypothetical protein AB1Y20_018452 [Prymnesium parvum]|uniref:Uncharacterized protein n=1 Tax=Prymnesium parvum TaxID=97485 RepID=A0AB34JND3_PRYPA